MGMFDDLIPGAPSGEPAAPAPSGEAEKPGMFDDLIPKGAAPADGKRAPEIKSYEPSLRDKTAHGADWLVAHMLGEDPEAMPSPIRDRIVTGLVGSRGLGQTNPSVADFSPAAPIFGGDEMQRAAKNGNFGEAALDALSVIPATGAPIASAAKTFKPRGYGPMMGATEASRDQAAAGKVAGAAQSDVAARSGVPAETVGPAQMGHEADAIINAGTRNGQDVRLMDVAGEATRGEARRAANVAPEARGPLQDVIEPRFEMQSDRTIGFLKNAFNNPEDAAKTLADLKVQARATNSANYDSLWIGGTKKNPAPVTVDSPGLRQMMQNDTMQGFYDEAVKRFDTMRLAGKAKVPQSVNGIPTLQFWDQVKRVIQDKIDSATPELAGHLTAIKNAMVGYIDQAVPKYKTVRGEAANFFKAEDAVEAGQNVVKGKWTPAEIQQVVAKMKPAELDQFQGGFLSDYLKQLSFVRDKRDILNTVMHSPGERAKIEAVLGPQKTKDFETFLTVETVMDATRKAMGNSTTVRQGLDVARGSAGFTLPAAVAAAAVAVTGNVKAAVLGAIMWGARKAQRSVDQSVAEKVADMLLSKDSSVYAKGMREVYSSQPLRSAFQAAVAMGAQGVRETPQAAPERKPTPKASGNAMAADAVPPEDSMNPLLEGRTATNPVTGARVIRRNQQWVPLEQ